jgi:hypothetical protein
MSNEAAYQPGDAEDFEETQFPQVGPSVFSNWIFDGGPAGWKARTLAGYSGTHSLNINAAFQTRGVPVSAITPRFDLSKAGRNAYLQYKYAAARKTAGSSDAFKVYTSINCDKSYSLKVQRMAASAQPYSAYTVPGVITGNYIAKPNDWRTERIPVGNLSGLSDVRFKFELTPNGGNNFYLDSLVILDSTQVTATRASIGAVSMQIVPNPAASHAEVFLPQMADYKYVVQDIVSKQVVAGSGRAGSFVLDTHNWTAGPYLITVTANGKTYHQRLLVQDNR